MNAQQLFAQPGYDQYDTLQIGGIRQVIHVKGARNAPVILFLHGGPGSSRIKDAEKFTSELQQKFTVVQWDQRETGRTLQLNQTNKPITLSLMERDAYELVNSLLKRFHKDKLYLAGESWGTVLGFHMAAKHPELLHAYLAFSPVVDQVKSEQMALSAPKKKLFWFANAGHSLLVTEAAQVQDTIINQILQRR